MATVYSKTLTSATGDTSGVLTVGSYSRLWVAANVSAVDWVGSATLYLSRLDPFDVLFPLASAQLSEGMISLEIGSGLGVDLVFGDRIQSDIVTAEGTSITGTVSIIGK